MSTVPELKIYTSRIYENAWWNYKTTKPAKLDNDVFFQRVEGVRARKRLFHEYLSDMTRILGITWKRKEIEAWLVGISIRTFSTPLTIALVTRNGKPLDVEDVVDALTHELIHNALAERDDYGEALKKLEKEYPEETFTMRVHILVHAVHAVIYTQKRGTDRLARDIESCKNSPDYVKAWEAVQHEGAENILKKYLGVIVSD